MMCKIVVMWNAQLRTAPFMDSDPQQMQYENCECALVAEQSF